MIGGGSFDNTNNEGEYVLEHIRVGTNNTPVKVEITASAIGFFSQSKDVTVFCGAAISIDFGRPPSNAAIEGYVTDANTGDPIGDVFIGSGFGGSTTTDVAGYYKLTDVPLNDEARRSSGASPPRLRASTRNQERDGRREHDGPP